MKNCNAELTKVKTIETWNNSTCSGSRFIIYGRLHNAENTYYKQFHYVYFIDYDFDDLADFAGIAGRDVNRLIMLSYNKTV